MPLNNPGASTAPFIFTSASFAVHARIHGAGNNTHAWAKRRHRDIIGAKR